MHRLTTTIPISSTSQGIQPGDTVVTLGSCFSSVVAQRLQEYAFPVLNNPFGTLYTPAAITTPLMLALHTEHHYTENDLFLHKGMYHALAFSSRFQAPNPQALIEQIEATTDRLGTALISASHLVITLGTAWQYFLERDHTGVGNCHKLHSNLFIREFTKPLYIEETLYKIFSELTGRLPKLTIILTVSPIRHLRNNPTEDSRSKAALIVAAQDVALSLPQVHYFPAYEIMNDELRDYRFYKEDLVHPTQLAETIIFERFCKGFMSPRSQKFMHEYAPIQKARQHIISKPEQAKKFGHQFLEQVLQLEGRYPEISLDMDRRYFKDLSR